MPTCNLAFLMQGAGGFNAVTETPAQRAILALLCQAIRTADPAMTCDAATIMKDGACWCAVTETPFEKALLQLLCVLTTTLSGGISGVTGVNCGTADPVAAPVAGCTIYYRSDNGAFWFWNGSTWVQFIAP